MLLDALRLVALYEGSRTEKPLVTENKRGMLPDLEDTRVGVIALLASWAGQQVTWVAMMSRQGRPREGARSAQRTHRRASRGYIQGGPGERGLLGVHWPLPHFCVS